MKIPNTAKIIIVILLTVAMAEFIPEAVNLILTLILVGVILGNWKQFSGLATLLGSIK